jgi:predicted Zn finger-like uncharacterized protein
MVEVQCSSCHTRYRVDEQVLPESTPTFKCSRCGHVFSLEPRSNGSSKPRKGNSATLRPRMPEQSAREPSARISEPSAETERFTQSEPLKRTGSPDSTLSRGEPPASPAATRPDDDIPEPISGHKDPAERSSDAWTESESSREDFAREDSAGQDSARQDSGSIRKEDSQSIREGTQAEGRMSRSSADDESHEGQNPAFEFGDEPAPGDEDPDSGARVAQSRADKPEPVREYAQRESGRWFVGDDAETDLPDAETDRFDIGGFASERMDPEYGARSRLRGERPDQATAPVYNRGIARSARFFVVLIFLVASGFAAVTIAIHSSPAAALEMLNRLPVIGSRFTSPISPASMVALKNVHAEYHRGRDGKLALIIEGVAENVSPTPLRTIRIAAHLRQATGAVLTHREVYCGNDLVTRPVAAMTAHEIEFFQELRPPQTFALDPSASCRFVIVFLEPPGQSTNFDLAVIRADQAGANEPPSAAG